MSTGPARKHPGLQRSQKADGQQQPKQLTPENLWQPLQVIGGIVTMFIQPEIMHGSQRVSTSY
jgi:hypothetical protein